MSGVTVTAGDTQPVLTITLAEDSGPMDLTDAASVAWHIVPAGGGGEGTVKTATIADPAAGVTTWQWDGTLTPGLWVVRAVVTWADGTIETTKGAPMTLNVQTA